MNAQPSNVITELQHAIQHLEKVKNKMFVPPNGDGQELLELEQLENIVSALRDIRHRWEKGSGNESHSSTEQI